MNQNYGQYIQDKVGIKTKLPKSNSDFGVKK